MKFDYSIIGKNNGKGLIAAIKAGNGPDALTAEELAFLQYPDSAVKQREFKMKIDAAILSGELKASGLRLQ